RWSSWRSPAAGRLLFPFQSTFHPLVDEAHGQDAEEHHHGEEAGETDLVDHYRPREEERDLEIEQDEEDRDQVVAHVEFHARVLEGLEAALVRRILLGIGLMWREDRAENDRRHAHGEADQEEQENRKVFCKHEFGAHEQTRTATAF